MKPLKYLGVLIGILSFACSVHSQTPTSIYTTKLNLNSLNGNEIDFSTFKGKKMLIVNVASKCGYTPQYAELQKLNEAYHENLVIIGVPCNQFGNQEPGSSTEIATFCKKNYGVTFLMTEKIYVKGANQHPLYNWLTNKEQNGISSSTVNWNFQKYLLDENGVLIQHFGSSVKPISDKITNLL